MFNNGNITVFILSCKQVTTGHYAVDRNKNYFASKIPPLKSCMQQLRPLRPTIKLPFCPKIKSNFFVRQQVGHMILLEGGVEEFRQGSTDFHANTHEVQDENRLSAYLCLRSPFADAYQGCGCVKHPNKFSIDISHESLIWMLH
ncbi:hypothetical protein PISMIDRAFT_18491 [Pisolithus microcarpus 441]|uniref:Uncharacterized protein n=1 Tax=Pisolithus microcarpus 441 TaxID=765257 RepID=A0A0C9Y749_9AGAM|nr:hypothetical protein PISMIDRAFT_18491 [Pisolithus microcarpus 441]